MNIKTLGEILSGIVIVTITSNKKVRFGVRHLVVINKNMKKILVIVLLLELAACRWFTSSGTPYNAWSNFKIPQGTPVFQQGYKDGCSTVLYARGNVWYRTRYKYTYDTKLIGNPEYRFGHSRGYTWCFQYILHSSSGPTASADKYLMPYGYDTTHNAANYNNAWDGFFGGNPMGNVMPATPNGLDGIFDVLQKGGSGTGQSTFGNPLWTNGSRGQFLGWD